MITSTLRSPMRRLRMTAAAAFILVLAQPSWAADFQIDNIRLDLGAVVVAIPKVDVKGSSLEREAFASLFNGSTGESVVSRTGRLTASEISAPELTVEQVFGPQRQVTTYRDIRFSEIRDGRISRGSAAGGAISATGGPAGAIKGEIKRISFEAFDMRHLARVLSERAKPGVEEAMQPIFGRFEQEGYLIDLGQLGKISLGMTTGRDFKMRVGDEPAGELLARILAQAEADQKAGVGPKDHSDPARLEADKRMALAMFSLFDTIDYGSGEARDMVVAFSVPPNLGEAPVAMNLKIARVAYGEDTPAKSGYVMEGFSFAGAGAKGAFQSLGYSGFSLAPMVKGLKELLAKPESEIESLDFRKLIPTLGTIRLAGLSVEVPQPAQAPIQVGLGTFEIAAADQINGIPTKLTLTIDKLTAPVSEATGNPAAADLIAMGYRTLDLSAKLDLAWDAARNELAIRTLSLGGAGMAQFEASGTLGNVTKDLFSSDLALAQVAALGATARSLDAKLKNLGLLEKFIENEARKNKRKPDDLRREYAMMASLGLAAVLGPSDAAKALTAAVSRFAAKPGTLTVQASAKARGGLGLADVLTITDPTEIFDKIDLKANAE
ncbi:hypothetical protein [Bosea sp. BIWAKO-01]|uniref:hypothetical protein n=1 Tax=Bosea sp. BIWAKO-01 TaxID=506668 RepID=UPI00086C923A|nr:hypothetical protein [Bosea sp. BIWAKO-01]GAU84808.1 hypothetical protein BIWAKO_04745 [Bosea sp. BIWAKO-01]